MADYATVSSYEVRLEALSLACEAADTDEADDAIVARAGKFYDFLVHGLVMPAPPADVEPDPAKVTPFRKKGY